MEGVNPELQAQFDALSMELRHWEVARFEKRTGGWVQESHHPPTDLGRAAATRSTNWLNWRAQKAGRADVYRMRPVVSIDIEAAMNGAATRAAPLVLSEDAMLTTEELDLTAPTDNEVGFSEEEMADLVKQAQAMQADPNTTDEDREKLAAEFMRPPRAVDFIPEASASFADLARKMERGE